VAEDYLASTVEAGGPPVEVVVHVEADSLADPVSAEAGTLDDGTSLPRATVERYVHELGFRIERRDDGRFAFFAPAGWEVKPTCAAPPLGRDPVAALRRRSAAAGMTIDDRTSFPRWDGTPPDYITSSTCSRRSTRRRPSEARATRTA